MRIAELNGIEYLPMVPCADREDLAAQGERLMLLHGHATHPKTEIFKAAKGVVNAGWVLGMIVQ